MDSVSFKVTADEFRKIDLREMLTIRFNTGERYLVEMRRIDFLDDGVVSIEGIGEVLTDDADEK